MPGLGAAIASMSEFLNRGKSNEQEPKDSPKALLIQATDNVVGKNGQVNSLLCQALTLIPSTEIDDVVTMMGRVCLEYTRLQQEAEQAKETAESLASEAANLQESTVKS
jgi:hypothetical protein